MTRLIHMAAGLAIIILVVSLIHATSTYLTTDTTAVAFLVGGACLALLLIWMAFEGAVWLLGAAMSDGFIGVVVYFAAWIIFFPVMLVVSIVIGILVRLYGRTASD
ncbi:MAG: hypothetical protein ACTSWM_07115 [Alphaproteobacteria bacterium]